MIVVMKPGATAEQVDHMAAHIAALGMTPQIIRGAETTVIAAIGEEREGLVESLEPGAGVEKVLPIRAPYKRASSELKSERTVVSTQGLVVGGVRVAVIAGPCSVEERGADRRAREGLAREGGDGPARRRVQAPDQSLQLPGTQGRRAPSQMLAAAREATGLAIVASEVMAPDTRAARRQVRRRAPDRGAMETCRTINSFRPSANSGKATMLKR